MAVTIPHVGASPLSFFVASPGALGPPSSLLADNIDPTTHDFTSLTIGIDPIDSQVLTALVTLRNSGAAVIDVGLRIDETKMVGEIAVIINSVVKQALSTLVARRDIQFRGVDFGTLNEGIDPGNQTVNFAVRWVNLRALDKVVRQANIPLTSVRGGF